MQSKEATGPSLDVERIRKKIAAALTLPGRIKVSFWGDTPLVSPRAAALLRDPETRDVLIRAIRGDQR